MNSIEKKIDLLTEENYVNEINNILKDYQIAVSKELHLGTTKQKHHGIFYTNYDIAYKITEETFKNFRGDINSTNFFEPSVGLGIFVITYLEYIKRNFREYNIEDIIHNIYIADIDNTAVMLAVKLIKKFILIKFNIDIGIKNENIYTGNTLVDDKCNIQDIHHLYNKNIKFDFILSNPPYRNMKASRKELSGIEYDKYRDYCSIFSKSIKRKLTFQVGTLNLYKIFFELILKNYSNEDASIGIIIPSSLLSDKSTIGFRKALLQYTNLNTIYYIDEKSKQFKNITQAMCFFGFQKKETNNGEIKLIDFENKNNIFSILPNNLSTIDSNYSFNKIDATSYNILTKIHKFNKLKEMPFIKNLRGELDLTTNKKYITSSKTKHMLLQGKNIKEWNFLNNEFFVDENFTSSRNSEKFNDIKNERIICQQISNMNSKKRLKFSKIPKNIILGNSCNYIVSKNVDTNYLLGLFNSYLLDWRFKLFSSNNHINNYELDDLPIILVKENLIFISYVKEILEGNYDKIIDLNLLVFSLYGLNNQEIITIMSSYNDKYSIEIINRISNAK